MSSKKSGNSNAHSAKTGRFVTEKYADANPAKVVRVTEKKR